MLHCQHDSFWILHVTFAVSCMTFLRVLQVTLTTPFSTIVATLLQVFLVTFAASCCTVSTTLFWILSCNFHGFVHNFSPGLSCSYHSFVLHYQHSSSRNLLDNPPSFCSYLLIVFCIVQLLKYCRCSLSS